MERNRQFDERYLRFAVTALQLARQLPHDRYGAHVGDQLFRSSTSVGSHLQEARAAESRADFIHKMQMALKEMREARYWLHFAKLAQMLQPDVANGPAQESNELVAILSQSVLTAKGKMREPQTSNPTPQTSKPSFQV